jgi:serine/threonine protein kinase
MLCNFVIHELTRYSSYSAPEVHSGQEYDQAVDCWSMGAIFYFLWIGQHAFMLPDMLPHQLLESILKGDYNQTSPEWININDGGMFNMNNMYNVLQKNHLFKADYFNSQDPDFWFTDGQSHPPSHCCTLLTRLMAFAR